MPAAKGQKGRKIGRNKIACEAYRRQDKQAKNAVLRQAKHLKRLAFFKARKEALYGVVAPTTEDVKA